MNKQKRISEQTSMAPLLEFRNEFETRKEIVNEEVSAV